MNKEMSKVNIAWEARECITPDDVRSGKVPDLIGFQEIGCHVVFDVKMDDYVFKRCELGQCPNWSS